MGKCLGENSHGRKGNLMENRMRILWSLSAVAAVHNLSGAVEMKKMKTGTTKDQDLIAF
jgi:hypothetical protein